MDLVGYRDRGEKRSGGVKSILLIDAQRVIGVEYDMASSSFVKIELERGTNPVEYQFKEREALYTEQLKRTKSGIVVEHRVEFLLEPLSTEATRAVGQLAEQGKRLVALVTTNNDLTLLVGYSERFEAERALVLANVYTTTGAKTEQTTGERVTLWCEDGAKAEPFKGEIVEV